MNEKLNGNYCVLANAMGLNNDCASGPGDGPPALYFAAAVFGALGFALMFLI